MEDFAEELEEEQLQNTVGSEPERDIKGGVTELPTEILLAGSLVPDFAIPSPYPETGMEGEEESSSAEEDETEEEKEIEEQDEGREIDDDHPAILRIDESLLARVNQVFVAPPGYIQSEHERLELIIDSYVFILYGDEHAGKLTCALHLAQDLLRRKGAEKRIYCYRRRPDESSSLLDFVRQDYVKNDRVYIIEDAFPSVSQDDLTAPFLHLLNEKLQEKRSFLLLTTENSEGKLPAGVPKVRVGVPELQQVFVNHLVLYETDESATDRIRIEGPVVELASASWGALQKELKDPDQIDEFCRRLGVQERLPDAEGLQRLAQEISLRRIEAARPWFAGLLPHEKLFAFLVVLFPGRDGRSLHEIFLKVIVRLREQGMNMLDPREVGYEDLLDRIRALEGPTHEIGFHERAIGAEVEWQLKNYNYLLWSLLPLFLEEIEESLGPEAWEMRRSRAAAVGRIGLYRPGRLRETLEKLARHPSDRIATAVGHAFSEVCLRARDADQEVCEALRSWVATGEPRLLWTAASCIWRVYGSLIRSTRETRETRERLFEILEELIVGFEAKNLGNALFAVKKIAMADPVGMVERLRLWLIGSRPALRRASHIAIRSLFSVAGEASSRKRRPALVELVGPVLAQCGEGSKVTAALFAALAKWTDEPFAMAALLKAANRLTGKEARAFRAGLSPWLANSSSQIRRLGGALLTRSLILEGAAVPALDWFKGALVLDTSMEAMGDVSYELIARRIWNLIQPRLDLRLVRMGERRELAGPGQLFPSRVVLSDGSRPRLLVPALEALDGGSLCIVIVLAKGPILDLEEVSMACWSSGLLLVSVGKASREPSLSRAISIAPRSPESGLAELAARVDDRFAAAIARVGTGATAGDEGLEVQLQRWVDGLDQPQSLDGPVDQVLSIFYAVLGLAESDLDRCTALLSQWLSPDRSDLELLAGSAAVRLLLRIEEHRGPITVRLGLFPLVTKLGACNPKGREIAFSTIRHWLRSKEWFEMLLDRDGDEPALLQPWIESLLPDNAEFLSRTLADWRRPSDDDADTAQRLVEAAERIEKWIFSLACDPGKEPVPDVEPDMVKWMDPAPRAESRIGISSSHGKDPSGFPMVWIEEIGAFMHWMPVTKIQFEKFIAATADPLFDDAWYRRILNLNPRVAIPEIGPENYSNTFLTGILPEEARRFAAWYGKEYALPTVEEWRMAYAALAVVPAQPGELSDLLEGAGELVRSALTRIEAASTAAERPGRKRTRADQMLMRLGMLEWAEQAGGVSWAGMGEPSPYFRTMWSIEKGPAMATDPHASRSGVFGFRLIRRPARAGLY
jgi:hypothetical protein